MNVAFLLRRFWHYNYTWPISPLDNFCSMQFGNHLLYNDLCFHREWQVFTSSCRIPRRGGNETEWSAAVPLIKSYSSHRSLHSGKTSTEN